MIDDKNGISSKVIKKRDKVPFLSSYIYCDYNYFGSKD